MFKCSKPAQRGKKPCQRRVYAIFCLYELWIYGNGTDLLLLASKQGVDGSAELLAALEEIELEDENVLEDLSTELLDERASGRRRATWVLLAFGRLASRQ